MTPVLLPNTQAILLLTAPLIAGRGSAPSDLLSPREYKRLARHLREIQHQPADLLSPDATEILRACQPVIDEIRLQKLLGRGFLLSQVIERWQARAIWVVSRADAEYPRRLKARLREDAPAVLYGCGATWLCSKPVGLPSLDRAMWMTTLLITPWQLAGSLLGQVERLSLVVLRVSIRPPCAVRLRGVEKFVAFWRTAWKRPP